MKNILKRALASLLVVAIVLCSAPLSGLIGLDLPNWLDFSVDAKAATIDKAKYSDMLARAEAMVNYTWTPSTNINTWKGNVYNGLTYFKAGSTVKGIPYTLVGVCSFSSYKTKASINKTYSGYVSGYGERTGPLYGSCCADFVCEVFGGSFMPNGNIYSHSVRGIKNSPNAYQLQNCKFSDLKIGDAVSDSPNGYHIIWIADITDENIVIYEQAPPVCKKSVLSIKNCIDKNGYFKYGGLKYSNVTRIDVELDQTVSESNSKISISNVTIPNTINQGTNFTALSGTISTNDVKGLSSAYVTIKNSDGTVVQKVFKLLNDTSGPLTNRFNKTTSYGFKKLCNDSSGNIDFSALSPGTYTLQIAVTCNTNVREFLDVNDFLNSDYFLRTQEYEFSVISLSRSSRAATAASVSNLKYDSNGNSYYTVSCVLGNNSSSSGSSSSSNNSYYNSNSDYPIGNYKVTAKSGLNTRKSPSATSARLSGLPYGKVVEVTATDGNWGYTQYGWICLDYASYEGSINTPVYNKVNYNTGVYAVSTPAGLNVRRGAGTGYGIITALTNNTEFSVTDVDGSWGYSPDYSGWLCLDYARWVSDLVPELPVPATPTLTTETSSEIGVGDIITLKWNSVDYAESYTLSLIDKATNKTVEIKSGVTGTDTSFTVPYAGTFDVSIVAVNSQHTSKMSKVYGITVKAPSTVTFKDWNGNVLSTQQVSYRKNATLPQSPTRTGYTFTGWSGKYENVTENSTVTAQYKRNTYTVNFYDYDGKTIVDTQKVLYQDSASAPSYSAPTGYSFVKWDKDFSSITENTNVKAVIHWTSAYPLEISTTSSIYRNNTAYITTAIVNNSPNSVTNAKVIVALKTQEGKQLAEATSSNLSLAAGEMKTITLTATYDGAATVGNIFVVKADDENIPLAKQLVVDVNQGTAWSTWSTSTPPSDAIKVESRTEYRYKTKSYTTSTSSSLSGWTKYNTTSAYSDWSGWSAWQDSSVSKTDLRDVKTQTVTDYNSPNYVTKYHYFRYANSSGSSGNNVQTSSCTNYQELYLTYKLTNRSSTVGADGTAGWKVYYNNSNYNTVSGNYHTYWAASPLEVKEVSSYNTKTQYSYRTRTLNYTYYYYKWSDWSSWSTAKATATSDKEVQTRTTYRYISNIPGNVEDTTGTFRTISGTVDASYAGKQALIHIYSADGQTQYLGQTTISSSGGYSYTFKLKNEPTVESGDYTVAMSIEGTTSAFLLDPILAPIPVYTVTFKNSDGSIIETQQVRKNENAKMPNSPNRTGYDFVGWSGTETNIQGDTTITAKFSIRKFDVVFIDNLNNTRATKTFSYGDALVAPAINDTDMYVALGWDAILNGITTVTENLVVTAQYQIREFTVNFYDFENNILQTSKVAYGDGIAAPQLPNESPYIFIAWDTFESFDYITKDMDIYPVYEYEDTVSTPTVSLKTGSFNSSQTVSLSCETVGADIYYTTDGTDPLEINDDASAASAKGRAINNIRGTLYTGPITLDSSANLVFVAVKDGMNSSWYSDATYAINTSSTEQKQHLVTIHNDPYYAEYSYLVDDDSLVSNDNSIFYQYGYTLVGVYTDEAMTNEWDVESDKVTESIDLYLKWEKNIYEVTFVDDDGNALETQQVEYLESALPPLAPEKDGYVFSGWDKDYTQISEDTTIKATYIDKDELTDVLINENAIALNKNEQYRLVAKVVLAKNSSNNHVIWQSADESIVTVDDNGLVTAVSYGNTTVYAVSEDSGMVTACDVTVTGAPVEASISIQTPSRTEIRCKDGIILHASISGTLPEGAYIVWTSNNNNFDESEIDESSYQIVSKNKGYTTFTATLYDADGGFLADASVEMYSKAGFFDKIGGFFRSLFGSTKIYES